MQQRIGPDFSIPTASLPFFIRLKILNNFFFSRKCLNLLESAVRKVLFEKEGEKKIQSDFMYIYHILHLDLFFSSLEPLFARYGKSVVIQVFLKLKKVVQRIFNWIFSSNFTKNGNFCDYDLMISRSKKEIPDYHKKSNLFS